MPRFLIAALCAAVLGSACKVERTPSEYFDHRAWSAEEVNEVAEEVRDRILATSQAIGRGSVAEAMIALAPAHDIRIIGPDAGEVVTGSGSVESALERMVEEDADPRLTEVSVTVNPQGDAAWFVARAATRADATLAESPAVVTGTYVMNEGAWELVQVHVSMAGAAPSPEIRE